MRRTIKTIIFSAAFIVLSVNEMAGAAGRRILDRDTWNEYTPEQKSTILSGFSWCLEPKNPNKSAQERDLSAAVRSIDVKNKTVNENFIRTMFSTLKHISPQKRDHDKYSNIDGLWWRQVDEKDRQAYVQGVLWCRAGAEGAASLSGGEAAKSAVAIVDSWYVIEDETWKDPRSKARVYTLVMSALKRSGALKAVEGEGRR